MRKRTCSQHLPRLRATPPRQPFVSGASRSPPCRHFTCPSRRPRKSSPSASAHSWQTNDGEFWLARKFLGTTVEQNPKTWSVVECVNSVAGLAACRRRAW
ncbi:hypothetical protein DK926_20765 [Rhodococcus sp. Eu-32]|nr:hypothetical protein DK926_20765 [Rhodococcus sp. Eu-32]